MKIPHLPHRRSCVVLIAFTLCAAVLTGCGGSLNGSGVKREIPAPGESSNITQDVSQSPESSQAGEAPVAALADEGTISSLDELKQNAISAGYETSDLIEIQKTMAEGIVGGFNMIIGISQNPVLEFGTEEGARAYAEYVNAAGSGAVLVNGRFFTYLEAAEDNEIDDEILLKLQSLMDVDALPSVSQDIPENTDVPTDSVEYKGAYALMAQISQSMSTLLDQALAENNEEHPEGDPQNTGEVMPLLFNSVSMSFTACFGEDEAAYAGIVSAAEMIGITEAKVTRNAMHDYTFSGKTFSNLPFEIHGLFDPANHSFRMTEKTEGKVTEFFEFIPMRDGQYAFQTDEERAWVLYRNGKLESFVYTKTDSDAGYNIETDGIFPSGATADDKWTAGLGADAYAEYYAFDGRTIKLSVKTFGGRVKAEIPA